MIEEGDSDHFEDIVDPDKKTAPYSFFKTDYSKRKLKDLLDEKLMGDGYDEYIAFQLRVLKLIVDAKAASAKPGANWDETARPKLSEASALLSNPNSLTNGFPAAYMLRFNYDVARFKKDRSFSMKKIGRANHRTPPRSDPLARPGAFQQTVLRLRKIGKNIRQPEERTALRVDLRPSILFRNNPPRTLFDATDHSPCPPPSRFRLSEESKQRSR